MKRIIVMTACGLLPAGAWAATRTYDTAAFERVAVAAGIEVDITVGQTRSVSAETKAADFEDLSITVEDNELRIGRPRSGWFTSWFSSRADFKVRVTTPMLRSLSVSSGADVSAQGNLAGDLTVRASSGGEVEVSQVKGGHVKASSSSGSQVELAGTCLAIEATSSSGSQLDAAELICENATVRASSGSEVSVNAAKSASGKASSGADVTVRGRPPSIQVETSSGADLNVKD